jgi:ATP:corrinoid adenosyltransferase
MEKGLVHIYCGDGKGKTSAAIGLAVRAAGNGMKVLFTRFLKTEDSGELKILDQISGIEVIHLKKSFGFYKTLSEQEKKEMSEMYFRLWKEILVDVRKEEYDVLVMDEFIRYLWLVIVRTMDFLRTNSCGVAQGIEEKECSDLLSVNFFVKSLFNFLKITFHIYIPIGH